MCFAKLRTCFAFCFVWLTYIIIVLVIDSHVVFVVFLLLLSMQLAVYHCFTMMPLVGSVLKQSGTY